MAERNPKGSTNVVRRTWDKNKYEQKAKDREEYGDEHVDKRIAELLRAYSPTRALKDEEPLAIGDEALLDVMGYVDGDAFLARADEWMVIEENPLLPLLFEQLAQAVVVGRLARQHDRPADGGGSHGARIMPAAPRGFRLVALARMRPACFLPLLLGLALAAGGRAALAGGAGRPRRAPGGPPLARPGTGPHGRAAAPGAAARLPARDRAARRLRRRAQPRA